ncbi:UNVERIFIED_CONTAM: hypothetical protein HHA_450300 [Hammondia hammondi]|eukprot:XP_008889265.1 hypothetical protein HHA_450300 [Hammondia hammondi]
MPRVFGRRGPPAQKAERAESVARAALARRMHSAAVRRGSSGCAKPRTTERCRADTTETERELTRTQRRQSTFKRLEENARANLGPNAVCRFDFPELYVHRVRPRLATSSGQERESRIPVGLSMQERKDRKVAASSRAQTPRGLAKKQEGALRRASRRRVCRGLDT